MTWRKIRIVHSIYTGFGTLLSTLLQAYRGSNFVCVEKESEASEKSTCIANH